MCTVCEAFGSESRGINHDNPEAAERLWNRRHVPEGMALKTEWQDMAPLVPKDKPMPQTREYWIQLAARDQELIIEQREKINRLEQQVNSLRQKIRKI